VATLSWWANRPTNRPDRRFSSERRGTLLISVSRQEHEQNRHRVEPPLAVLRLYAPRAAPPSTGFGDSWVPDRYLIATHGRSEMAVKNEKQYEKLKDKGMSKERAAKIANSPQASKHGGEQSGNGGSSNQGGTTAQKKKAGRKGGKAAARKS
jgi:hypothetical protein